MSGGYTTTTPASYGKDDSKRSSETEISEQRLSPGVTSSGPERLDRALRHAV
jgi:hypothetical protein